MFSKFIIAFVATLAVFVAAAPTPDTDNDIRDSCNTGKQYCCNDTYDGDSETAKSFANALHVNIPANTKIGTTCSPISVLGLLNDGSSCNAQPVCCTGNDFTGVVVIGCSPINLNL